MSDLRPNSEIADGIHWLKDSYVNNYIIEYESDLILIDAGLDKKAKGIINYIRKELESKNIKKILITHHHLDHIGGLHYLYDIFHPMIYASESDAEVISGKRKAPLPNNIFMKPLFAFAWLFVKPKVVNAIEYAKDGDMVDDISVISLPGHTKGSLAFLKDNAIFTGDTGVVGKNGDVGLGVTTFAENIKGAKYSLLKLSKLDFDMLLPGHGTPILEDASIRTREAVERMGLVTH